jgi:mono/diheme cytochrome c family protein
MSLRRVLGVLMVFLIAACGGGGGEGEGTGEGEGEETAGGEVPEQYAGPTTSTDAAAGAEVYERACAPCHTGGDAPQVANVGYTAARMRQQIREGSGQMPPISESRLSNEDMEALLAHLKTMNAVTD